MAEKRVDTETKREDTKEAEEERAEGRKEAEMIQTIRPYKLRDTWYFDDGTKGVKKEPFAGDINKMITAMTAGLVNPHKGFKLLFSDAPFVGFTYFFDLMYPDGGGAWYSDPNGPLYGWLCPVLMKYFDRPPQRIFTRVEPLKW